MKRILIMGASSGIGMACAEVFARAGMTVGLAARHTEKFRDLQKTYPKHIHYSAIDITKPDAKKKMLDLIERMGGMDIYFHVSGIARENPGLDPEKEVEVFDTNTIGFVRCICTAYRYYRNNDIKGQIAAVTSVAGTNGLANLSAYSASKAADRIWLTALMQLSNNTKAGITFTDIRPGWITTPLFPEGHKHPLEMPLEYAVPKIVRAIIRKKRVAVIDWRWNLVTGLWRLIPNAIYTRLNLPVKL